MSLNPRGSDVRAFVIASVTFVLILVAQNYIAQNQFTQLVGTQREAAVRRADTIAASVLADQTERLVNLTELLSVTEVIPLFMSGTGHRDDLRVSEVLSEFRVNTAVKDVFLFDSGGVSLLPGEVDSSVAKLERWAAVRKVPVSDVVCTDGGCLHSVAIPVLFRGRDAGVIVSSYDLLAKFEVFENTTGARITVARCMGTSGLVTGVSEAQSVVKFDSASRGLPRGFCFFGRFDNSGENAAIERLARGNLFASVVGYLVLALALVIMYFLGIRSHRRAIRGEVAAKEEKSAELNRVSVNVEKERRSLAAELHDELGQRLVPIRFQVSILRTLAEETGAEALADVAHSVESGIETLSRGVSSLIESLRPPLLDTMGLKGSIESIVSDFRRAMPGCLKFRHTRSLTDAEGIFCGAKNVFKKCEKHLT